MPGDPEAADVIGAGGKGSCRGVEEDWRWA